MNKTTKAVLFSVLGVLLTAGLIVVSLGIDLGWFQRTPDETEPPEITPDDPDDGYDLGRGLRILRFGSYAGMFVEDGSDEIVSGLVAVTVRNTGDESVQLARFTVRDADGEMYSFELTTLLPGEKVMVLEKDRKSYKGGTESFSAELTAYAAFAEEPTLCPEVLELTGKDNAVTVKNISGKPVSDGYVYYKNKQGETLIGGITYRVSFGALQPGASVTVPTSHFSEKNSVLVFAVYAEQ